MTMPEHLIFIRHGQSEANAIRHIGESIDESVFTEEIMTVPDNSWRLTRRGTHQARTTGIYLNETFNNFDKHINSPFVRTRETAAAMNLRNAKWYENRSVRERSWGEIDSMSKARFKREYPTNYLYMEKDPIYWTPPAGESLAEVAENRASNFLKSLSRENLSKVITVSHGEFITAARMIIEQWSDDDFHMAKNSSSMIRNCAIAHYTRRDPVSGVLEKDLTWVRISYPDFVGPEGAKEWKVIHGEWSRFGRKTLSNAELKNLAEAQAVRITKNQEELTKNI